MLQVRKYDLFKLPVSGEQNMKLVEYCAVFTIDSSSVSVPAFQKSSDEYMVHFMPDACGIWSYEVSLGNRQITGEFECVPAAQENHGPVTVREEKFYYADGVKYLPFGTTCYAWTSQDKELQEETLRTLAEAPFNKLRMCVFPKSMPYNNNDPDYYPFRKNEAGAWDVQALDFDFWDNFEDRLAALAGMGIEADIILFHPYDRWGFSELSQEDSLTYLEYCIARFAVYHNVWWSLANEYEMLYEKTIADWDEYGEMLARKDPYGHLISIHNILHVYPKRAWMTHCSIQSGDIHSLRYWKKEYQLPVIIDEFGYEGDLEYGWGNLSAFEMVHRFWSIICRGGYGTHGETFHRDDEVLWWAKGGKLYGESPQRIRFLKELFDSLPDGGEAVFLNFGEDPNQDKENSEQDPEVMERKALFRGLVNRVSEHQRILLDASTPMMIGSSQYQLWYYGRSCPGYAVFSMPEAGAYRVEVIDIWNMTRTTAAVKSSGKIKVDLPGKEGIAVLIIQKDIVCQTLQSEQ